MKSDRDFEPVKSYGPKFSLVWGMELATYSTMMYFLLSLGALREEHRSGKLSGVTFIMISFVGRDNQARPDLLFSLN